jgi:hypothetical protein
MSRFQDIISVVLSDATILDPLQCTVIIEGSANRRKKKDSQKNRVMSFVPFVKLLDLDSDQNH